MTGSTKAGLLRSREMSAPVPTAVFPAAGLGTRILPATKAFPKELLPLVDRPIIQYGVAEAVDAGVTRIVLVTSPTNTMTSAHFSQDPDLEAVLSSRGKVDALAAVRGVASGADVVTVHQSEPLGLGHAVLMAREQCHEVPFAVALPDDVLDADPPVLRQMVDVFQRVNGPVILVERVPHESVGLYGVIDATPIGDGVYEIHDLVEKPHPDTAPSDLAIVGRYIMTPDLFPALEKTGAGAGGEIQLTDALRHLSKTRALYACEIPGAVRHDVGSMLGFVCASIYFALKNPDLEPAVRAYLRQVL